MTTLTKVADGMLAEPEIVRLSSLPSYDQGLQEVQTLIDGLRPKIDAKVPVGYQIKWSDLKTIPFAWNQLPGVPFATDPQWGLVQLDDNMESEKTLQDHYKAATSYSLARCLARFTTKIPSKRKVCGHTLENDLTLVADDAGFYQGSEIRQMVSDGQAVLDRYVPLTYTLNGKPLQGAVTLTAADVGGYTLPEWLARVQALREKPMAVDYEGTRGTLSPYFIIYCTPYSLYGNQVRIANDNRDYRIVEMVKGPCMWSPNDSWVQSAVVPVDTFTQTCAEVRKRTIKFLSEVAPTSRFVDPQTFKINGQNAILNDAFSSTWRISGEDMGICTPSGIWLALREKTLFSDVRAIQGLQLTRRLGDGLVAGDMLPRSISMNGSVVTLNTSYLQAKVPGGWVTIDIQEL